ncbi:MAG: class I SAM-dependent methyltransferase [Hyphomicrobiaceae bacterium]|nr:class I SAM-dependent methyltransferase [Hyphomicrobiaceae bacterium]
MALKICCITKIQSHLSEFRRFFNSVIICIFTSALRNLCCGKLEVILPSGTRAIVFDKQVHTGCDVVLQMNNFGIFWKSIRRGTVGFAASYIDGDFEVNNLANIFRFFLLNKKQLGNAGRGFFKTRLPDKLFHRSRVNTQQGSKRNIAAHYDLGNAFYNEWLDDTMTYSSALFSGNQSLEQAQQAKYQRIADLVGVAPGKSLLEIGCGWGGMSEMAAKHDSIVTAITVSRQQLEYVRERISRAGLKKKVDVRFEDYRCCRGTFDSITSIEMIEAVGEENWDLYFSTLAARLKQEGRIVIQAITIDPELFKTYRKKPDFIQRFIFPGGMLPTERVLAKYAKAAGLKIIHQEMFGQSYTRTLKEWRMRFLDSWPRLKNMGFDEKFRRMWLYYLTYCEVGFEQGTVDVGIYVLKKTTSAMSSSESCSSL